MHTCMQMSVLVYLTEQVQLLLAHNTRILEHCLLLSKRGIRGNSCRLRLRHQLESGLLRRLRLGKLRRLNLCTTSYAHC